MDLSGPASSYMMTAHGWARRAIDRLIGLVHGFFFFFYLINRGRPLIISENTPFTITFDLRWLLKSPQLIFLPASIKTIVVVLVVSCDYTYRRPRTTTSVYWL